MLGMLRRSADGGMVFGRSPGFRPSGTGARGTGAASWGSGAGSGSGAGLGAGGAGGIAGAASITSLGAISTGSGTGGSSRDAGAGSLRSGGTANGASAGVEIVVLPGLCSTGPISCSAGVLRQLPSRAAPGLSGALRRGSSGRTVPPKRSCRALPVGPVLGLGGRGSPEPVWLRSPRSVMCNVPHTPCPGGALPPGVLPISTTSRMCNSSASMTHWVILAGRAGAAGHADGDGAVVGGTDNKVVRWLDLARRPLAPESAGRWAWRPLPACGVGRSRPVSLVSAGKRRAAVRELLP